MATLTLRSTKGSPLTHDEVDANFTNLNTDISTLNTSSANWNTAFGWGDHSTQGYITSEADTFNDVTGRGATTTSKITVGGLVSDGEIEEQQYSLTGTDIDPANGTIQYKTLVANATFTESLTDGEYVTLMISLNTNYTVTWPTTPSDPREIQWVGGAAPTLETTGFNVINLWAVNSIIYGFFAGAT